MLDRKRKRLITQIIQPQLQIPPTLKWLHNVDGCQVLYVIVHVKEHFNTEMSNID